jgi:hypothetical protein
MDWEKLLELNLSQFFFITTVNIIYYIIGGYGNIISLIIFNNNEFKKQPATFYLNAACIMNLVTILYSTVMFLAPIWQITSATCKLYQWLIGFITRFQAW